MRSRGLGRRHGDRSPKRLIAALGALLLVVVCPVSAGAADPVPAPLSSAPPAAGVEAPARALPRVATVCRVAGTTRCWVRPGEDDCRPGAEPFRVVPERGPEVQAALADCRTPPESRGDAAP